MCHTCHMEIHLDSCTVTISECEINSVRVWQACLRVPPLHFLAPASLNKTHHARPHYISIAQTLPQISGIWCHVLFLHKQPLSTLNSHYLFLFPVKSWASVRIAVCRRGHVGVRQLFFLTDAAAPPFAGNAPLNSVREKQLASFKAPERKSPAVPRHEEFRN